MTRNGFRAELTRAGNIEVGIVYYEASTRDCSVCSLKPKCTTPVSRKVSRDVDVKCVAMRALVNTEGFQQSRRERAHGKRILRLDRLRLGGLSGAKDDMLLTATSRL